MRRVVYEVSISCICLLLFTQSDFPKTPLSVTILSFYLLLMLSGLFMYLTAKSESQLLSQLIYSKEKARIRTTLVTILNLCLMAVSFEPYLVSHGYKVHTGPFFQLNNNIGWTAIIILGFSFLLLPTYMWLRLNAKIAKSNSKLLSVNKKIATFSAKFLRKYHVPIALIGILFVFYHVFLAIVSGLKFNLTYISGYLALLDLLTVSCLGLLRYKKADKNLHKILTYVLIFLLILHYIFSKLRL